MKILHLIDSGGFYGAEKMLLALVLEQIRLGLDPMILSVGEPGIDDKGLEREARRLNLPIKIWRMRAGLNLQGMGKIFTWASKNRYELIHSHGYKFNVLAAFWPRKWRRFPVITTLHGWVRAPRFSKIWLYEFLDRLALRRLDAVCTVSSALKDELQRLPRPPKNLRVIPNGIDIAAVEAMASEPVDQSLHSFLQTHDPIVLGVGRLSFEKGFDLMIDAFQKFSFHWPKAGLLIVGEGREWQRLMDLAAEKGVADRILFSGYINNIPSTLTKASMLVISSRTEGLPITLLEAMTVGTPIVANAVGAIPDVLNGGESGIVVRSTRSDQLLEAMNDVIKDHSAALGRSAVAKRMVKSNYSVQGMAAAYNVVYRELVGDGRSLRRNKHTVKEYFDA